VVEQVPQTRRRSGRCLVKILDRLNGGDGTAIPSEQFRVSECFEALQVSAVPL
jgi:hypothetical protein